MHIPNNIHRTFAMTAFIFHKAKTIIGVGGAILILFSITHKEQIFLAISALLRDSQSLFAILADFIHRLPMELLRRNSIVFV